MSEPDDPSRLLDSPDAPAGLKHVLRAAQADVGSDEQVARLAERLGPLLGAGAAAGTGAAAGSATLGGAAKLGIAAVALMAVGGGALLLSSQPPRDSSKPVSSLAEPARRPSIQSPTVTVTPAPSSSVTTELAPPPAISAPPRAPLDKPSPPALPSEAELLEQARAALKSDPSRALQRASEHARRFPRGVLVQEREVLAIQALRRLGRDAEADRRVEAFAKAFPGSAFQRKLQPSP